MKKAKRKYSQKVLRELREKHNCRCFFCQRDVSAGIRFDGRFINGGGSSKHAVATVDHLTPISRGGRNHPDNMVLACGPCNYEKGDMTLAEYVAYKERQAKPLGIYPQSAVLSTVAS